MSNLLPPSAKSIGNGPSSAIRMKCHRSIGGTGSKRAHKQTVRPHDHWHCDRPARLNRSKNSFFSIFSPV
eukprot:6480002-Amphidinium_carterae.1